MQFTVVKSKIDNLIVKLREFKHPTIQVVITERALIV